MVFFHFLCYGVAECVKRPSTSRLSPAKTSTSFFSFFIASSSPSSPYPQSQPPSHTPQSHHNGNRSSLSTPQPNTNERRPPQVQGHHGIPFATSKPEYGTYKSPYGPKYASSLFLSVSLSAPSNARKSIRSKSRQTLTSPTATRSSPTYGASGRDER